jgi:DNA-directed RNA polymerase subunit RPC12/RpoP
MSENSVLTHYCPNCGGALMFDPKSQNFHCEYCNGRFTEQEVVDFEAKQNAAKVDGDKQNPTYETENDAVSEENITDSSVSHENLENPSEVGLFLCPSCGAELVTEATTASTFCYYCHNPVVLTERLSGQFLPEKVLPFQIEHKEAEEKFLAWVGKKKFVPKEFFNKKQIQNLAGVYFPYWAVDADLTGEMSAEGTNLRVWVAGEVEYTEHSKYAVRRAGDTVFKDLVKNALQKNISDKMVGAVQPFDMSAAIPFKNQYLSGFTTEKRDIEFAEMKANVENEFQQYADNLMESTISGYSSVINVQSRQSITRMDEDYVLLPIWLVTYKEAGNDKLFYYAMNGQTGKVAGVLPIDKGKLWRWASFIFICVLIFGIMGGYLIS